MTDVLVAILAGIGGYAMNRLGYSTIPFLVAFILSPIAERNFYQALIIADGSFGIFVTSPVSGILIRVTINQKDPGTKASCR